MLRQTQGNPEPLGWVGFGMVMAMIGLHGFGLFEVGPTLVAMMVFAGAATAFVSMVLGARHEDTFSVTACGGIAAFWASLAWITISSETTSLMFWDRPEPVGSYLVMWALFAVVLFIGSLRRSHAAAIHFGGFAAMLGLWAATAFTGAMFLARFTGVAAMIGGVAGLYIGLAVLIEKVFGRRVLPLGDLPRIVVPDTPASLIDFE